MARSRGLGDVYKRQGMVCEQYYPELIEFIKSITNENKI
jgi:hypothetical protein